MSQETFAALLVFLGAVVAAVLYVVDRSGKRLADSIPSDVLTLMLGLLDLADRLAAETPTTADDDLIKQIRDALKTPTPPAPEPSPFATPEELAARLDPQAQG